MPRVYRRRHVPDRDDLTAREFVQTNRAFMADVSAVEDAEASRSAIVYGLLDHSTLDLRYIGQTTDLVGRMHHHWEEARRKSTYNEAKSLWVRDCNGRFASVELEIVPYDVRYHVENAYILAAKVLGCSLVNTNSVETARFLVARDWQRRIMDTLARFIGGGGEGFAIHYHEPKKPLIGNRVLELERTVVDLQRQVNELRAVINKFDGAGCVR